VKLLSSSPTQLSVINLIISLSKMNVKVIDLDSITQKRIKSSLLYSLPKLTLSSYWKLLSGLANMGYKWNTLDVATRVALALPMRQYLSPLDWETIPPKEVISIVESLRSMKASWRSKDHYYIK
jgi:hypothetical protein